MMNQCLKSKMSSLFFALGVFFSFVCTSESNLTIPFTQQSKSDEWIQTGIFQQKLDHFSDKNKSTFNQKFITYTSVDAKPNHPVFYMLGNESAINESYILNTALKLWADTFQGTAIILEHRFYGDSIPVGGLSLKNYHYLTTPQALEDFSVFQNWAQTTQNLKGPWIVIGSSYAGNLAAYYKLQYPDLTVAALISSAPLFTKTFNTEMDEFVSKQLSPECLNSLQSHFRILEENTLKNPFLKKSFLKQLGGERFKKDEDILFTLSDVFTIATQMNFHPKMCAELQKDLTIDSLIRAFKLYLGEDTLYSNSLIFAENRVSNELTKKPSRSWYYQTCREYGFYQLPSENESLRFRSLKINKDYYKKFCKQVYNLNLSENENTLLKNYREQLKEKADEHFIILNGLSDPWSTLSILNPDDAPHSSLSNFQNVFHGVGIMGNKLVVPTLSEASAKRREIQDTILKLFKQFLML